MRRLALAFFGTAGVLLALAWWRWARRELQQINPSHPDLPRIVLRVSHFEQLARKRLGVPA